MPESGLREPQRMLVISSWTSSDGTIRSIHWLTTDSMLLDVQLSVPFYILILVLNRLFGWAN